MKGFFKTFKHNENVLELGRRTYSVQINSRSMSNRGGVESTSLEAQARTQKILSQGQGQPFRGQTPSRPRKGMLEANAKDTGASVLRCPKKRSLQIFQQVSGVFLHNFNGSKNSAVLEPRTGEFSRT